MYYDLKTNNKRPLLNVILTLVFIFSFPFMIITWVKAYEEINENTQLEKRYTYKVVVNPGLFEEFVYCDSVVNDYAYNKDGKVKLVGEYKVKSVDKNKWN